jgi:acetyltransferase-like isoleucine patch superfamily enzyme/dTDP-4-dehydrorhamnose 3,5-epimerase-like enzyme
MSSAFIHPNAICESADVGEGTRVWAFAHVLPGARIGRDCNICDGVFVENKAVIGDRVTIKCGVQVWDEVTIENDVFIGPNATFTNDLFPRSRVWPESFAKTIIREGASIGANATILAGNEIGAHAMVGAGAVVTRSVPPNAIVVGNPARIRGYVVTRGAAAHVEQVPQLAPTSEGVTRIGVGAATLHNLKLVSDMRGALLATEFGQHIPFMPKRQFTVFNVPTQEVRGEHAHRVCEQFLICIKGSCQVLLDDGLNRREVSLDKPNLGVYMPAMIWGTQYRYSSDAVLMVFASHHYDGGDYIRTYDEFLAAVAAQKKK